MRTWCRWVSARWFDKVLVLTASLLVKRGRERAPVGRAERAADCADPRPGDHVQRERVLGAAAAQVARGALGLPARDRGHGARAPGVQPLQVLRCLSHMSYLVRWGCLHKAVVIVHVRRVRNPCNFCSLHPVGRV